MRFKLSWQCRHCNIVLELHNQKLKPINLFEGNLIIFDPCLQVNFTELHLEGRNVLTPALPGQLALPAAFVVWNWSRILHDAYWDMRRFFQRTVESIAHLGLSHDEGKLFAGRSLHGRLSYLGLFSLISESNQIKSIHKNVTGKILIRLTEYFFFLWPIIL